MATRLEVLSEIVDKHFTNDHPYCKVFFRKTLKVSYSCILNVKQLIMAHNRKMLYTQDKERRMCDCRKQECPVNGRCLMENVIYRVSVTTATKTNFYVGSTGLTFKNRYTKHKHSFRHEKYSNTTNLSQYIWKLKNNNVNFRVQWEILTRKKKNNLKNRCKLCNAVKIQILNVKKSESLIKRNELQTGYIHYRNQFI